MNKAIFLDRDGTLNYDKGYICSKDDLSILSGVVKALKFLKKSGFLLIIITNQSAVGRGLCSLEKCEDINQYLFTLLKSEGVLIDEIYTCPHAPWENCKCRKPSSFLVESAIEKFNINSVDSYMFGDKVSDVECGERAGVKSYLITEDKSLLDWCNELFDSNL